MGTPLRVRDQYFLEILISEDKDNYYGRVHCNDEPKQNPSLSTHPLYFIAASRNLFESLSASGVFAAK